ncbi:beta-hexosaminidase subunit alpha-like [Uloborus diversus]|uniref:beta-hexosaminidase subunit alpha-like n=1 Tax=Uloborus diversus TaxID=327109 RepID=UPI00240A9427|nr:beta-hexosaminidase subunit alpha-like [Uloborus diversus]XP_054714113.1 beta-hexosaminidase subunit alpha-like [Uloborus diversus]
MKILVVALLCFTSAFAHYISDDKQFETLQKTDFSKEQVWPLPQQYVMGSDFFIIRPGNFKFLYGSKCDIIKQAIQRYQKIIFRECSKSSVDDKSNLHLNSNVQLLNLTIKVVGPCEKYPYMNMDEQYILRINTSDTINSALLFSTTVWGALRGLETFSQLVFNLQKGIFGIYSGSIRDFPRFPYRGLMLDTSRHFIPVPVLLKNLDAMAQTKLNVFHWHIVDDQSFPYVSKKFPNLSLKGAYDSDTHIYTPTDISEVIEYARLRGIRVLVEYDTPGHTLSWGKGRPKLLTPCFSSGLPNGQLGPINPTKNETYQFLKAFFAEVINVFPDAYLHLGGDEVSFDCWASNPDIQAFMAEKKFGDNYALLEGYYISKLLNIIKSLNKSYIVWQEVFDNQVKIKPDTIVHIWKNGYKSELTNVTLAGYNAILSACWYLSDIAYGNDWISYYSCEPHDFSGTEKQKRLVIGGEACMWGEYVDGTNVITRTWPRAAAVAEKLWSSQSVANSTQAMPRLEKLRCNMIKNGLKVEPVNGPGYCQCDFVV